MDGEDLVRGHYSGEGLEPRVIGALVAAGVDVDSLTTDDLAGLDQLHAGFGPATEHLLDSLSLSPAMTLLDVGCGVGGPARMAAVRHGCLVTGLDLSRDFIELARSLTERVGLGGRVSFDTGSATDMPYPEGSFDRAMLNHVGMNIADKARVFAEVRRVLRPDGLFAVYEQMRTADGDLPYPLPWAETEESSFVEHQDRYAAMLEDAGFTIDHREDRTGANAAAGPPPPGALTPAVLFGPGFGERIGNNIAAAMAGTLSAVLMVARAG